MSQTWLVFQAVRLVSYHRSRSRRKSRRDLRLVNGEGRDSVGVGRVSHEQVVFAIRVGIDDGERLVGVHVARIVLMGMSWNRFDPFSHVNIVGALQTPRVTLLNGFQTRAIAEQPGFVSEPVTP